MSGEFGGKGVCSCLCTVRMNTVQVGFVHVLVALMSCTMDCRHGRDMMPKYVCGYQTLLVEARPESTFWNHTATLYVAEAETLIKLPTTHTPTLHQANARENDGSQSNAR